VGQLTGTGSDSDVPPRGPADPNEDAAAVAPPVPGVPQFIDDPEAQEGATVRKGMGFAVASFAVNGVLGLVGAIITSRLYGVDVMGQYALVVAPWILLIQLSNVAERVALVREIAGLPRRSPRVTGMFVPVLGFSVVLTTLVSIPVMLITAAVYRGPAGQPELVFPALCVVIGYILLDNTSGNLDGVFSAFRSGRDLFIGRLVQIALFPILAVVLIPWEKTVTALTVATIATMAIALAVRAVLIRAFMTLKASRSTIRQGLRDLPDLLKFGLKVVPGQLIGGFGDQAGTWVLGAVAPISVVGSWSRAFGLAQRMNEAGYRITEILYPTLVQRYRAGDLDGFGRAMARTVRFTSLLVFLLAAVVGGAANGVLSIFGPGFSEASGAFAILLLLFSLSVLAMCFAQGIVATGHPHQLTITAVIRFVLALGLLVPGAIWFGSLGAALGLFVSTVVEVVILVWLLVRYVGPHCMPGTRFNVALAVAVTASFGVSRVIDLALPLLTGVAAAIVVGTLTFSGIVLTWALDPSERAQILGRVQRLARRG
jgi:O-antigen/teichoic acid export membrane protein